MVIGSPPFISRPTTRSLGDNKTSHGGHNHLQSMGWSTKYTLTSKKPLKHVPYNSKCKWVCYQKLRHTHIFPSPTYWCMRKRSTETIGWVRSNLHHNHTNWWFTILEIPGFTTLPQQKTKNNKQPTTTTTTTTMGWIRSPGSLLYCSSSAASAASGGGWDQTRLNLSEKRSSWWQLSDKVDFCCQCFSSWWFQPIWKIFVKLEIFPK